MIGNSGIYKLRVIKKTIADELSNYSDLAYKLQSEERENLSSLIISALENTAQIEDNRSDYYWWINYNFISENGIIVSNPFLEKYFGVSLSPEASIKSPPHEPKLLICP